MTRHLFVALFAILLGCSKSRVDDHASPTPPATPPASVDPKVAEAEAAYKRSIAGHESWRPSSAPCPIKMSPLAPPKPGQNLGQAALDQGRREGQLNTNVVKSFDDARPITRTGDAVEVLYVEAERVNPELDPSTETFRAGTSKGVAYVWDASQSRFACMANVSAQSSPSVTSLGKQERSANLWLAMDLMFAIEREVAANARMIVTGNETESDAGITDGGREAGGDSGVLRRGK